MIYKNHFVMIIQYLRHHSYFMNRLSELCADRLCNILYIEDELRGSENKEGMGHLISKQ